MWFVDIVTWKSCVIDDTKDSFNFNATSLFNTTYSFDDNKCVDKIEKSACIYNGGRCNIDSDGYYTEVVINVVYGIIWYQWAKRTINFLQELPISDWHVLSKVDKPVQIEELEEFEGGKMSVKS